MSIHTVRVSQTMWDSHDPKEAAGEALKLGKEMITLHNADAVKIISEHSDKLLGLLTTRGEDGAYVLIQP